MGLAWMGVVIRVTFLIIHFIRSTDRLPLKTEEGALHVSNICRYGGVTLITRVLEQLFNEFLEVKNFLSEFIILLNYKYIVGYFRTPKMICKILSIRIQITYTFGSHNHERIFFIYRLNGIFFEILLIL